MILISHEISQTVLEFNMSKSYDNAFDKLV